MTLGAIIPNRLASAMAGASLHTLVFGGDARQRGPAIVATVLAYLVLSAFTIVPYVVWRSRARQPVPA